MADALRGVFEVLDGGGPTVTLRVRCPRCSEVVVEHTYAAAVSEAEARTAGPDVARAFGAAWQRHRCAP